MIDAEGQLSRFLSLLAHELRNPLAPIRNSLHLIRLASPPAPPEHAEHFAIIDRQVENLVRLVDDLLDVSRLRLGKIRLQKERLDLVKVVEIAVETAQPLITARGHDLNIEVQGHPVIVDGDAVRLVQVLSNLLNNAAKYTPEGGKIWVTVRSIQNRDEKPSLAEVCIRDNGVGIAPELQPVIFELFGEDARTTDGSEGGLRIGLALVRHVVEVHGGSIQVYSAGPGQGSEFVLQLPLASTAPTSEAERPAGIAGTMSARRRVLIVDDNQDSALTLARLVRALGHKVATAGGGAEALSRASSFRPEILLLDIGMPDIDGYAVAAQLRRQPEFSETLFVALTGYGTTEDRKQSQAAGFNAHLVKPVDLNALLDLLAHPEELRQPHREPR
jgi:two-component system CheB/CheR fusion protein